MINCTLLKYSINVGGFMQKLLVLVTMLVSCIEIYSVSAMKCEENTVRLEFYDGRSITMKLSQSIKDLTEMHTRLSTLNDVNGVEKYNYLIKRFGDNSLMVASVCEIFLSLKDNDADSVSQDDVTTLREKNVVMLIEMNEEYKQCYSSLASKFSSDSQAISVLRSNDELLSAMLKCAHDKFSSLEVALGTK